MRNNTAELIQRILEGDDAAFACLVKKYQKRVHALVWRKIGDFHIAEDITQETFLQTHAETPTRTRIPPRLQSSRKHHTHRSSREHQCR